MLAGSLLAANLSRLVLFLPGRRAGQSNPFCQKHGLCNGRLHH